MFTGGFKKKSNRAAKLTRSAFPRRFSAAAITSTKNSFASWAIMTKAVWGRPIQDPMFNKPISHKAAQFTESVIREMTRLAMEHKAINLSQGYPDFPAPDILKKAAADAI